MIDDSFLPPNLREWTKLSLDRYGLTAGRKMGQHFLVDKQVLKDILKTAALTPASNVLEVGGGLGVLTLGLLSQAGSVVVVELDNNLAQALIKIGAGSEKFKIIIGDVIKISTSELKQALNNAGEFEIVANLPYEITGAFINRFLWGDLLPKSITLLVQREVAERMIAPPGSMSLLALGCQLKSTIKIVRHVPPQAFWPPPKVNSSIVRLDLHSSEEFLKITAEQPLANIWKLAKIGFSSRRKLLLNNLANGLHLPKEKVAKFLVLSDLGPKARAQELSVSDWVRLAQVYKEGNND